MEMISKKKSRKSAVLQATAARWKRSLIRKLGGVAFGDIKEPPRVEAEKLDVVTLRAFYRAPVGMPEDERKRRIVRNIAEVLQESDFVQYEEMDGGCRGMTALRAQIHVVRR